MKYGKEFPASFYLKYIVKGSPSGLLNISVLLKS